MSIDQAAKLAYQLILLISAFLHPVDKCEKKVYACYFIGKAVSKAIKR